MFERHVKMLEALGVNYTVESEWRGEGKDRKQHTVKLFNAVSPPFTPFEWCHLCQNEGNFYVGGCCGNMSAVQDLLDHAFRFGSGWFSMKNLETIADYMAHHDEPPSPFAELPSGQTLEQAVETMRQSLANLRRGTGEVMIDVWKLLALIWHIVKPFYSPDRAEVPARKTNPQRDEFDDACRIVQNGLLRVSMHKMFSQDATEKVKTQKKAGSLLVLAQVLPALKLVWENVERLDPGAIDGVALVKKDDPDTVLVNGFGLCIYQSREHAQEILDLWTKERNEYETEFERKRTVSVEDFLLRPVKVSVQKGLEFVEG